MDRSRSVSPLGESRFEKPFVPPLSKQNTRPSTSASSRPIQNSDSVNITALNLALHETTNLKKKSSMARVKSPLVQASSLFIKSRDMEKRPISPVSPTGFSFASSDPSTDEWFDRFRSDTDLGAGVSDEPPDRATLSEAYDTPLFSANGSERAFGTLFDPRYATHQRQLIIFVRHFFCGACQAYLKALSEGIPMHDYFAIPIPTSIIVIGCGQPDLIEQYKKFTQCPFPMFADPSRQLFRKLGMVATLSIGQRPEYMKDISVGDWASGQFKQVNQSLKEDGGIRKRDILRGGHPLQVGGEFLFHDGDVVWCNRMKTMRDHAEISVLRQVLELDEA